MVLEETLAKFVEIQSNILDFIDNEESIENSFHDLRIFFNDQKISENKYYLELLFHLITSISKNHHRGPLFFSKIEEILNFFKDDIKNNFSNSEIFNIFKSSKRILLSLIEANIFTFDEYTITKMKKYHEAKYFEYFAPEIKPFITENWFIKDQELNKLIEEINKELPSDFDELRKEGENESLICQFIRKDSVEEFIQYVNKTNTSLKSRIGLSTYETNSYFLKNGKNNNFLSLIEYSVFFGAIQIFQYLRLNNVHLPQSLWYCAVHGNNPELIHLLEEDSIKPECQSFKYSLNESIKCFHSDLFDYFKNNRLLIEEEISLDIFLQSLKYYNFALIDIDSINQYNFDFLCKYDYTSFVDILIKTKNVDVDYKIIFKLFF